MLERLTAFVARVPAAQRALDEAPVALIVWLCGIERIALFVAENAQQTAFGFCVAVPPLELANPDVGLEYMNSWSS